MLPFCSTPIYVLITNTRSAGRGRRESSTTIAPDNPADKQTNTTSSYFEPHPSLNWYTIERLQPCAGPATWNTLLHAREDGKHLSLLHGDVEPSTSERRSFWPACIDETPVVARTNSNAAEHIARRRLDMLKKRPLKARHTSLSENTISLFDPENLELLDALRYRPPAASSLTLSASAHNESRPTLGKADQTFAEYRIADHDETWGMGELNVKVIHRGRIRISRKEWQQVINTCSAGLSEGGIRMDFHLNILQHPNFVRLVYISYRYKQIGDKQQEHRRGILLDEETNIQNMMTHLAFWFTAQPHAENKYSVFETLVDEAMMKLAGTSPHPQ